MPEATSPCRGWSGSPGGASRETYRFELHWTEGGGAHHRKMILRRDPPASLIDTERRVEFEAYRAFRDSPVPVPEMLWLEEDSRHLDHPFFIAEEIAGHQASPQLLFSGAFDDGAARRWPSASGRSWARSPRPTPALSSAG
jgi:aminoglycoside phosphotransferase (APT) family kinase protein